MLLQFWSDVSCLLASASGRGAGRGAGESRALCERVGGPETARWDGADGIVPPLRDVGDGMG